MDTNERYKEIENTIASKMLTAGFLKKSGNYKKDYWFGSCLVGLQKSKKSNKEKIEFTINIGLIPEEPSIQSVYKTKGIKEAFFCPLRTRIGYVNGVNDDRWYFVDATTPIEDTFELLLPELEKALRWLGEIKNSNDLVVEIFKPMVFTLNDTGRWFISLAVLRKHDRGTFEKKLTELRNTDTNLFADVEKFLSHA